MKRHRKSWQEKLDGQGRVFLEVYRQARPSFLAEESRLNISLQAMVQGDFEAVKEQIARCPADPFAEHPELWEKKTVSIKPEYIRLIEGTPLEQWLKAGSYEFTPRLARILDLAQELTLHMEGDRGMRVSAYFGLAMAIVILGEFFEDLYKREFGNQPFDPRKAFAVAALSCEFAANFFRGRYEFPKGRINAELVGLVKFIREHEKEPLTPSEMREALLSAGVSVPEGDTFRLWLWRSVRKNVIPAKKSSGD